MRLPGPIGGAQEYKFGLFFAGDFAGFIFFVLFLKIDLDFDTHSVIGGSDNFAGCPDLISRIGECERHSDFFPDRQVLVSLNKNA